ncbi:unnamed protein product [Rhizoctonia solani]|uniref:Uncharacterized protein n=1 Tax=Rhizoctonia solani TaxID=456999 RepID=A0A8H3A6I1_9AGAM|nr:unnamed protein product [Rhizoctonia solani]CAE6501722.1 unnamed protein product [Rhizoctonia solani]
MLWCQIRHVPNIPQNLEALLGGLGLIIQDIVQSRERAHARMVLSRRIAAKEFFNWRSRRNSDLLLSIPLPDHGTIPTGFPRIVKAFKALPGEALSELIAQYGIVDSDNIPGKVAIRRGLLARHIGMPVIFWPKRRMA